LLGGGVGAGDPLLEVNVKSKEENSQDFGPNYVQEFCLCTICTVCTVYTVKVMHDDE
jgi:hypothetical protein